jgi:hypothetical protein
VPFISAASRRLMRDQEQPLRGEVEDESTEQSDADHHGCGR